MKSILALGIAASFSLMTSASAGEVPANDSRIVYEGRTAVRAEGAVELGFPGVVTHLRFQGGALSIRARASSPNVLFDLSVDGGEPTLVRLQEGDSETTLVSEVRPGVHEVELTRRNEGWRGTCLIRGFTAANGELLAAAALPIRKLLFIGDSVTCGELAAWVAGGDLKDGVYSDARASYGMLLARRLKAQCELVSYGGRGVIRDWQGIRATNNAPEIYELCLPDDPATLWNPARYVPDAIGIQLGTNDFGSGIPDQTEFVVAYVEFIRKVRRDAPDAWVFVMDSPMLEDKEGHGPRRTALHDDLIEVVARIANPKVILAPLKHYPGVPGNGHPTGADHIAMADELEPVFRRALGW